uniref:SXP/RAL-2 family protein Ani s 5-like cation-binding domain-containing protein n=1 Tax=Strongyloides stercoralis TaxID=6248 RepID=A0AAF5I359_STRER
MYEKKIIAFFLINLLLITNLILIKPSESTNNSENEPQIEEQRDGLFYQQQLNIINFDFNCKCIAKVNTAINSPAPLDSNAQAQQQIQQLQEQVKRLQETIKKTQQGSTPFETFANTLSLAEGLDCSCSGAQNDASSGINQMGISTLGAGTSNQYVNPSQLNQLHGIVQQQLQGGISRAGQLPIGTRYSPVSDYVYRSGAFYP